LVPTQILFNPVDFQPKNLNYIWVVTHYLFNPIEILGYNSWYSTQITLTRFKSTILPGKKNAFRFIDLKMDFYGFPAILQRDLQKLEIDF
jgi:hypothetical protein